MNEKVIPHIQVSSGFSTIEILIAFSVGIIFLTAAIMVAFSDPTLTKQISLDGNQATAIDANLDNNALATSSNKLGHSVSILMSNWKATLTNNSDHLYTNTPTIIDIAPCLKEITNTTTWNTLGSRSRHISFGTALGDITTATALGRGGCDPLPPTEWDNPDSLVGFDPTKLDSINDGIIATAIDVRVIAGQRYAFMTSQHLMVDVHDFWIINVTNPESPQYVSSVDINNQVAWGGGHKEGANDLVVIGDYAYILRNHQVDQLQVIDVSDPTNPTLIAPAISFESRGVNKNGTDPQGEVIKYYNGKLYIGLHNTQGPELLVYNTATPSTPSFVGAIASSFNHSIHDIAINENYAYLAIKPGTGAQNTKELMVINIAATTPTNTGNGFNAAIGNNDTAGFTSLYLLGTKLYAGREQVNSPKQDFYVFDVQTAASPQLLGSKNLGQISNSSVQSLYISDGLAFLGLTKDTEFRSWSITNPGLITLHGCSGLDLHQGISEIAYADNFIFAAIKGNDFLRVIYDETNDATCN